MVIINSPLTDDDVRSLKVGDQVEINGIIYAARDAAHKKLIELLNEGKELPFDIKGQIIYYVGPCPEKPGEICGSAGPTTSSRMDAYASQLITLGLKGMIGKGIRSMDVINAMKEHRSAYFGAIGGAGALISKCIVAQEVIAFPELGPEALRKMTVKNFPVTVIIDSDGNDLYKIGKEKYQVNNL